MNTLFVTGGRGKLKMPLAPEGKRARLPAVEVDTYICPGCGAELKVGSRGCPRCASRKKRRKATVRAWDQSSAYDGLDLPAEDFDYDDFVAREFDDEEEAPHRKTGLRWYWWLAAVLALIATVLTMWL